MDFKLADALMRFFDHSNPSDPAQRLFMLRYHQDRNCQMQARGRQILNHIWQGLVALIQTRGEFIILTTVVGVPYLARFHMLWTKYL